METMLRRSARSWTAAAGFLAAVSASACDAPVEGPEEAQVRLASNVAPATEGAWAECRSAEGESGWSRTVCPPLEPGGEERDCSSSRVSERQEDDSMWCEVTALCNYQCEVDADCPQPQSGTVVPVCNHICYLPCGATSECPDGMTCHHFDHGETKDAQGLCRYVYTCD
jgi:hypothetical protein